VKKLLLLSLFLCAGLSVFAQQGIGVRLGDPSGISYKKYNGNTALEFSIGRSHSFNGRGFYNNHFSKWYAKEKFDFADYHLLSSELSTPLGIHVHYLIHTDWFASEFRGLQWYYGFGGTLRFQSFKYMYEFKVAENQPWQLAEDKVTDLDIGADAVLGIEYEFEDVPIRVFIDITLFMEIVNDPFRFWPLGGIGGRYMF
jgi:hypothetical protein